MLLGLLITFVLIRSFVTNFPTLALMVNGTHVHHFLPGVLFLGIAGYLGFWVKSFRKKYFIALGYGAGMAFILDEFYFMLRLDASPINYQQYDAVVIGATLLSALILLPGGIHEFKKLFGRDDEE